MIKDISHHTLIVFAGGIFMTAAAWFDLPIASPRLLLWLAGAGTMGGGVMAFMDICLAELKRDADGK